MSNHSGHKEEQTMLTGLTELTEERRVVRYGGFYLTPQTFDMMRDLRQWKLRGSQVRFAEEFEITRQFSSMIVNQLRHCPDWLMWAITHFFNIPEGECWCHLFSRSKTKEIETNHPQFNLLKFQGIMPYRTYSPSAIMRQRDYSVESRK